MKYSYLLLLVGCFNFISAQTTLIPDANFEQRLIDFGYDVGPPDGSVPTANIAAVTDLIVPNSLILDLTGIEDFTALEVLDISGNGVSVLDLSSNVNLRELYSETNPVTSLNISNNPAVEILRVGYMLITELDVSGCPNLLQLQCQNNQLTGLDLSNNSLLTSLGCPGNQICELDLSSNPLLTTVVCAVNNIRRLDLKSGSNSNLVVMSAFNNDPGICIEVDDEVAANAGSGVYGSWIYDATATLSENCPLGPEIELTGNGLIIAQGDNTPDTTDDTDFGSVEFGQFVEHTFTIANNGDSDLTLSGAPLVQVSGSTDFTVVQDPATTISAAGSTDFILRYEPSMAGTINTALIEIENDDCNLSPFSYTVRGESTSTLSNQDFKIWETINIWPIPTDGLLHITAETINSVENLELFNLNGQRILEMKINDYPPQISLDLSHLNGLFLLKVQSAGSHVIKKLVIY